MLQVGYIKRKSKLTKEFSWHSTKIVVGYNHKVRENLTKLYEKGDRIMKHVKAISKRGRTVQRNKPCKKVGSISISSTSAGKPIGKKSAQKMVPGLVLPQVRGVQVQTPGGKKILFRPTQKGAILYKWVLI